MREPEPRMTRVPGTRRRHEEMADFTHVSEESAKELVTRWPAGEFRSIKPITAGIENTNYFVDTDHGRWVLTIFEKLTDHDLPFYLSYM